MIATKTKLNWLNIWQKTRSKYLLRAAERERFSRLAKELIGYRRTEDLLILSLLVAGLVFIIGICF